MTLSAGFHPENISFGVASISLSKLQPLLNGEVIAAGEGKAISTGEGWRIEWDLAGDLSGGTFQLLFARSDLPGAGEGFELRYELAGIPPELPVDSLGLRFVAQDARAYLRSGYFSWDGSFYVQRSQLAPNGEADPKLRTGYVFTQLLPESGAGSVVLGFLRHDRFQHRCRFAPGQSGLAVTLETLWDRSPHDGLLGSEPWVVFGHGEVEEALRLWARLVAAQSPTPPRVSTERITGWCSWYNLYAGINEDRILEHLAATREARDSGLPLRVFQVDDGFTPEMGDWLEVKPQFPRGMKALLADIRSAGFRPGLWIAPFLVGNRSRLFREHPDWVVRERGSREPLAHMKFYGEFRWHKSSEEYYVLDVTHPDAEAYIRRVFRTWRHDWGCEYFKTDFMNGGSDYGPDRARWHREGLTRIEVWMRMARLIREEIGDALWLGSGCPLFAPVGLVDAVRIGRDVGVKWQGDQSAESLLRDQTTRNFANGILWQSDPDCILLRDRFHHLSAAEVESVALFAGLAGGLLMTSDHLGKLSPERRGLLRFLLGDGEAGGCRFPLLGQGNVGSSSAEPLLVQVAQRGGPNGPETIINAFNTGPDTIERLVSWSSLGLLPPVSLRDWRGRSIRAEQSGLSLRLGPHESSCVLLGDD